ncbi:MAG: hypothetical protein HY704_08580 [Gemmatimonadetes bacterium]|nr:hypothetical protein [Gemmatimonadota bacterium]
MSLSRAGAWILTFATVIPAQAPELGRTAARVAELWSRGDAAGIGELAASAGIQLQLLGERHLPVGGRRVAAALKAFFPSRREGDVRVARVAEVGGEPRRGFAELEWATALAGEPAERLTLYIGFVLDRGEWRVTEIRVLP